MKKKILLLTILSGIFTADIATVNAQNDLITRPSRTVFSLESNASASESDTIKDTETDTTEDSKTDTRDDTESKNTKKETTTPGIKIQKGKKIITTTRYSGKFIEKKGNRYFKKTNGKRIRNIFFTFKKNVYHAEKNGVLSKGWRKYKGHYYFFNRKSGKLSIGTKQDNIKIKKTGIAKETKYNVSKIQVLMRARKIMNQVSSPGEKKSVRLYKCFKWMEKFGYRRFRTYKQGKASYPSSWELVFANDIFKRHAGCCVSESCAFAFLAKECGYKNVTICSDSGHAWTDIGGKLYDPLFAEARSFRKNYNAVYTDYRKNASIKKKV